MAYHLNSKGIIVFHRGRPTLGLPKNESDENDLNENGPALSMKDCSIDADDDDDADLNKNESDEHRELEREKSYEEEDESEKRNRTIF